MGTELKPVEKFEIALEQEWGAEIASVLPPEVSAEKFVTMAVVAARRVPELLQCSRTSLQVSLLECARAGLYPDGKEAVLIPYGGQAEFMPMTKGIINLILRSPGVEKVEARAVRENDEFDYWYGANPDLIHRPAKGEEPGEITAAYAIVWRQGTGPTFEVVDREEIEAARNSSRAPNSPAWKNWYSEMARKVALKRLSKYLDLSPEASRAIEIDHAVTGDPRMEGSYDGPSPEYERQLVKSRTEEGINRLKDKMNGGSEEEGKDPIYTREDAERDVAEREAKGEPEDVPDDGNGDEEEPGDQDPTTRPYPAEAVRERFAKRVEHHKGARRDTKVQGRSMEVWQYARWMLARALEGKAGDSNEIDAMVHSVSAYLTGKDSANDWTGAESLAILDWLTVDESDREDPQPSDPAKMEAWLCLKARMDELGVQELPGLESDEPSDSEETEA